MMSFKKRVYLLACVLSLMSGQAFAQIASPHVIITELDGQQVFQGDGGYDQIDYGGNSTDYTFIRNADLSVSVTKPDGVTDRLINIDGFWFSGEQQWYAIEDLETPASSGQTIRGNPETYDQVDYHGNARDYTFVRNANMSVSVTKPGGDIDTLIDIDGVWFADEQQWHPIGGLIQASSEGRTITGGSDYDQVDYPGASLDYIFVENVDGSVTVTKPDDRIDTLIRIDGVWFQGEEAWHPIESLIAQNGQTIVGTNAYDQVDYDGFRKDYIFIQNEDGSVRVNRPSGVIDNLTKIDGFWFRGEEAWYSIEDILDAGADTDTDTDTGTLINGVITGSNDVNDNLIGTDENNAFFAGRGIDLIRGLGGEDTLHVDGDVFEWTYAEDDSGIITMTHPTWGVNTLINVELILALRAGETFTVDQAIALTNGLPAFRLDNDNVINGTPGNDVIPAQVDVQGFYGGLGDDTYQGTNNFEQVNYDGARAEYTFVQNANGSVRISHPIWGTDTLVDIDALIFTGIEPGIGGERSAEFEFVNIGDIVG